MQVIPVNLPGAGFIAHQGMGRIIA